METNTEWEYNTDAHEHIKHIGQCTVFVWQDVNGQWATKIESGRRYAYRIGFLSLPEARAWCEQEAAQFTADDRRRNARESGM